jgi:uncharacterized membrane protein YtjA (UPF0391 family)
MFALVAALFGFGHLANAEGDGAKFHFYVFLILSVIAWIVPWPPPDGRDLRDER